jgi:membrane protein YqaA with SNARE-associated domain
MIYALILGPILALLLGGVGGYYLGRYQVQLVDKIRTLEGQSREAEARAAKSLP